jgi:hypothetical protein
VLAVPARETSVKNIRVPFCFLKATEMNTTPAIGFEFFPSPEKDEDEEGIAYAFLYCTVAVREWPEARRRLIEAGYKSAEECGHIEAHAINVFREVRDIMFQAIESGNLSLMSDLRLMQRFTQAHALLALYANPGGLPEFRDMILPSGEGGPSQADFNAAVWEAGWNARKGRTPRELTREQAMRHRRLRKKDGSYNSRRRCDPVASAEPLQEGSGEGPALLLEEQSELIEREIKSLILQLRKFAKRAGLKPASITFLVEMALRGKRQKDNPTAWRAIRRKSSVLYPEIRRLVASIRKLRENCFIP